MPSTEAFVARLCSLFTTELQRQGVAEPKTWVDRLPRHCRTATIDERTHDVADGNGQRTARTSQTGASILVLDLSHVKVMDKVVVALCEALLKMESPSARLIATDVAEWQLRLRDCGLSDRVLHHLQLLLSGCPKLSMLDAAANTFSDEGKLQLQHAAAEVPCDVVVEGDKNEKVEEESGGEAKPTARTVIRQLRASPTTTSSPSLSLSPPAALALRESTHHNTASYGSQRAHKLKAGATQLSHMLEVGSRGGLQRSPSLTATSTSASPSARSYASGSAVALQRRREELFGRPTPTAAPLSSTQASTSQPAKTAVVDRAAAGGEESKSSPLTPPAVVVRAPLLPSPVPLAMEPSLSHSPFLPPRPQSPNSNGTARATTTPPSQPYAAPSPAAALAASSSDFAGSREPFVDRNDRLDLTANLSPVLDSVLVLSAVSDTNGQLAARHRVDGARTLWELIEAREEGVAAMQTASSPSRLLHGSTNYHAITVLNISHNHLISLCALPATLLRLDVSSNALSTLSGVEPCRMLAVLNARRNKLHQIVGLEKNRSIAHLFLGHNHIAFIEGLAHLVLLETLDVTYNELRTQSSLRMLSLCATLQHLLIRGNPVVASSKAGIHVVLRNLCPTLLVVDEQRVGSARLAERALAQKSWARPSTSKETGESSRRRTGSSSAAVGTGGNGVSSSIFACMSTGHGASMEGSISASGRLDRSRVSRSAAFADAVVGENEEELDTQSLGLLQLLTRGVTVPTGYGDSAQSQHTAQKLASCNAETAAQAKARQERRMTANGRPLRGQVVKQLAEESRRYIEETIGQRMAASSPDASQRSPRTEERSGRARSVSPQQREQDRRQSGSVERNSFGGLAHPEFVMNGLPSVIPFDPQGAGNGRNTGAAAALLKAYEPRGANRPRRISTSAQPRIPVASTHASALRAASLHRGPTRSGGGSDTRSVSPPSQEVDKVVLTNRKQGYADAGPSSYSALYAAASAEAEIECSPITKDPHARLVTSLSTNDTLHDRSAHREPAVAPPPPLRRSSPSQRRPQATMSRSSSRGATPQGGTRDGVADPVPVEETRIYPGQTASSSARSPSRRAPSTNRGAPTPPPLSPFPLQSVKPQSGRRSLSQHRPASAPSHRTSMQSIHVEEAHRQRVRGWTAQLATDTAAVQEALQTLVELLEAQRQQRMPIPESSRELPATYLQERRRCVSILTESGMLGDTQVPMEVVVFYGIEQEELEGTVDRSVEAVSRGENSEDAWRREVAERAELLRLVHLMGDAKTCLRYVCLLVGDGREKLLQQYVDQLKESLSA